MPSPSGQIDMRINRSTLKEVPIKYSSNASISPAGQGDQLLKRTRGGLVCDAVSADLAGLVSCSNAGARHDVAGAKPYVFAGKVEG